MFPVVFQQLGMFVGFYMQRDHFRRKPGGKFNSLTGNVAPVVDGDDRDRMLAETGRVDGYLAVGEHLHVVVVAADDGKENDGQGNEEQRDPGAFREFRDQHDDRGRTGDDSAESVDQSALHPVRTAIFPPVHDHPGLRKREGEKRADRVERDQTVGDAAEKNENTSAECGQDANAVGVDEPASAVAEDMRQVIVLRDGAAETRKIGEGGVGRQR